MAIGSVASAETGDDWTPLFNGEDLSGWKPSGKAAWTVERGSIVGRQGPDGAAGDLLTEQEFEQDEGHDDDEMDP